MATQSTPLTDAAWTPKVALLTDEIANEVYASHYAERKMSRFVIGTLSVLLLGSFGAIVSLAHKPIQTATSASTRWAGRRQSNTAI